LQLKATRFIEPAALYEPPFNSLHEGGPEELFAGKTNIIDGIFHALEETLPKVQEA
jgi:type I restriction enzyme R subunit